MENKKVRSARMSKTQKEILVTFLEQNRFLLETKVNPCQLEKFNNCWKNLVDTLNAQPGATKTINQWKEALNEFKANTRKKARAIHLQHTGTGGGPKIEKDLNPLEERLLMLLSNITIVGAPVCEGGLVESQEFIQHPRWLNSTVMANEEVLHSNKENECIISGGVFIEADKDITPAVQQADLQINLSPKPGTSTTAKKKMKRQGDMERIAQKHEKCLRVLADSNNNLAQTQWQSTRMKQKKRMKSAVFSFKF